MHIHPWDVVAVMISYLLKNSNIARYNINAADHSFWLGASCIDYNIEFRNYGYTVSLEKRGLKENQLVLLPYYPIVNDNIPFQEFPGNISSAEVKIFSGGSFYKIYDKHGTYLRIVKRILLENENAVFIYAGSWNNYGNVLAKFIKDNNFENRVYLTKDRKDIYQIFDKCDIYLGTYPLCGGLMSQYAAICGKPILAYTDPVLVTNFIEGIICHQKRLKITYTNLDDFFKYAKKLCTNKKFRAEQGKKIKQCIIPPDIFNKELEYIFKNNSSIRKKRKENIDYIHFTKFYMELEKYFFPTAQRFIVSIFGIKSVYKYPKMLLNVLWKTLLNKLKMLL
jgi:hypothetical protein